MVDIKSTMVFSGNANKPLAKLVAKNLGTTLGKASVKTFSDGEISVEIEENVKGRTSISFSLCVTRSIII